MDSLTRGIERACALHPGIRGVSASSNSNRNFMRTDDATKHSEKTATAFNASQTSHNSRKKL